MIGVMSQLHAAVETGGLPLVRACNPHDMEQLIEEPGTAFSALRARTSDAARLEEEFQERQQEVYNAGGA